MIQYNNIKNNSNNNNNNNNIYIHVYACWSLTAYPVYIPHYTTFIATRDFHLYVNSDNNNILCQW